MPPLPVVLDPPPPLFVPVLVLAPPAPPPPAPPVIPVLALMLMLALELDSPPPPLVPALALMLIEAPELAGIGFKDSSFEQPSAHAAPRTKKRRLLIPPRLPLLP